MRKLLCIIAFMAGLSHAAESDTRVVQSEFDRCKGIMERVDRSIQRLQDAVATFKRSLDAASSEKREGLSREMTALGSRSEYFRSRFDRAAAQADKIRDDLKNVKGGRCSSCISSSVNMYCRNAETILTDIEEQIAQTMQLESRLGNASLKVKTDMTRTATDNYSLRKAAMDSIVGTQARALDSCSSASGKKLWSQSKITIHKADSLRASGSPASEKALEVAELLLKKAMDACGYK